MASFSIGDLVVLKSGSMRMAVEAVDGERVACVWCHEGEIGRDNFDVRLVKTWEHRDEPRDDRGPPRGRPGGAKPYGGDKDGGSRPYGGKPKPPRTDRDDRPKRTGFDGKPREKKYYRADD